MMQCVRTMAVLALLSALAAAPAAAQFKPRMPKIGPIGGKEPATSPQTQEGKVEVTSSMWAFSGDELAAMEKRGPELYKAGQALQDRGY
jgi:hypothetical protein